MKVFERILCPIDFSETSVKALQWAEALARNFQSELIVLHVQYESEANYAVAERRMNEFLQPLRIHYETVIVTGRPSDRIADYAKHTGASLIVIGTHALKGFKHHVLGSTTEKIIRNVSIPVLTITPNCTGPSVKQNARILMGIASLNEIPGSSFRLRKLVKELQATLSLMHVVELQDPMLGLNFYSNSITVGVLEAAKKQSALMELGAIMIKEPPAEALIQFGDAAQELLKEAPHYDFLCMDAKEESLRSRFLNSHIYRVICEAPVPVITLKRF